MLTRACTSACVHNLQSVFPNLVYMHIYMLLHFLYRRFFQSLSLSLCLLILHSRSRSCFQSESLTSYVLAVCSHSAARLAVESCHAMGCCQQRRLAKQHHHQDMRIRANSPRTCLRDSRGLHVTWMQNSPNGLGNAKEAMKGETILLVSVRYRKMSTASQCVLIKTYMMLR